MKRAATTTEPKEIDCRVFIIAKEKTSHWQIKRVRRTNRIRKWIFWSARATMRDGRVFGDYP